MDTPWTHPYAASRGVWLSSAEAAAVRYQTSVLQYEDARLANAGLYALEPPWTYSAPGMPMSAIRNSAFPPTYFPSQILQAGLGSDCVGNYGHGFLDARVPLNGNQGPLRPLYPVLDNYGPQLRQTSLYSPNHDEGNTISLAANDLPPIQCSDIEWQRATRNILPDLSCAQINLQFRIDKERAARSCTTRPKTLVRSAPRPVVSAEPPVKAATTRRTVKKPKSLAPIKTPKYTANRAGKSAITSSGAIVKREIVLFYESPAAAKQSSAVETLDSPFTLESPSRESPIADAMQQALITCKSV